MNAEIFYFVCFLVGLFLSAFSLLGGMGHVGHVHFHLPGAHGGHVAHVPHTGSAGAAGRGSQVPWWNAFTLMIFLCWFGAAGYLLTRYGVFAAGVVVVLAALCGVMGGAIVFLFLTKVLMPHDHELTADETDVVGVLGKVTAAIRPGGTGEVLYVQLGARRAVPARGEDGEAFERGEEVYVVRYEKGVAWVRRWEESSF